MKQKIKIIVLIGCILTLVNMGIAGLSAATPEDPEAEELSGHQAPAQIVYHADANGPYSGTVNSPISFSGAGTQVGSGPTYEWDFNDPYNMDNSIGYGKYPMELNGGQGSSFKCPCKKNP